MSCDALFHSHRGAALLGAADDAALDDEDGDRRRGGAEHHATKDSKVAPDAKVQRIDRILRVAIGLNARGGLRDSERRGKEAGNALADEEGAGAARWKAHCERKEEHGGGAVHTAA